MDKMEKMNKTKRYFIESINKVDKSLVRLILKKRSIISIRNEKQDIITYHADIKEYYEQLNGN